MVKAFKKICSPKDIFLSLVLVAILGALIFETKTEPKWRFYHKVMSYCNVENTTFFEKGFRKYWQIRNIQSIEIDNKHDLVDMLFLASYIGDSTCNSNAFNELDSIAMQGYKFDEYRDNKNRSWLLMEVLVHNPLTVNWLLNNGGFVITGITSKSSPYYEENIFELSVSLNEKYATSSTKEIMLMLNEKKESSLKRAKEYND